VTQDKNKLAQLTLAECHLLLKSTRKPMHFRDLLNSGWNKVQPDTELSGTVLANLYTNLNLDARFVPLGKGQWGLAEWQPRSTRSSIPATSLLGKTYQGDRPSKPARPVGTGLEEGDEDSIPVEEPFFPLEEDEDEPWDEEEGEDHE
jgi:DNA-directed RNA polymerase subunit delta